MRQPNAQSLTSTVFTLMDFPHGERTLPKRIILVDLIYFLGVSINSLTSRRRDFNHDLDVVWLNFMIS